MSEGHRFEGLRFPDDGSVLDVDVFAVGGSERVAVFGPNGAGKTTLLRRIAGTIPGMTRRPSVAYLPQRAHVFHGSVRSNLALGVADADRAVSLAEALGIGTKLDSSADLLSGGERQRLGIARTLASAQPVVALDEPLAAIERAGRDRVVEIVRAETEHRTLIGVTHDLDAAVALAETLVVMDGGRVVQRGPVNEVTADPTDERVREIIGITNVLAGVVTGGSSPFVEARFGSLDLTVAADAEPGQPIVVRCAASTIAVHATEPDAASQRNVVRGTVSAVTRRGPMFELTLDGDPPLAAVVTPGALDALGVGVGSEVWFAIKTASIDVVSLR